MISLPSACATQPATAILMRRPLRAASSLSDTQPSEFRVDLFGGLFADVAGIENHQIGVVDAVGSRQILPAASVSTMRCAS